MKSPQERSTDIRIDAHTVVAGSPYDNDEFRVLTKSSDKGSNYGNFLIAETVEGAEAFRDVLQYLLVALSDDAEPPERYNTYTPVTERDRAFSDSNSEWDNSYHGDDMRLKVVVNPQYVALYSKTEYADIEPIHFNDAEEVEKLIEAVTAWIEFKRDE